MRQSGLIWLILANLLLACTTTAPESASHNEVKAPLLVEPKAEVKIEPKAAIKVSVAAIECPISEVICPMNYAPVVCSAGTYDGNEQPISTRLMVWASNICVGRLRLNKEACSHQLLPSKLGDVYQMQRVDIVLERRFCAKKTSNLQSARRPPTPASL